MSIHYEDSTVTLHHGDCLDVLRELPDASVDSVCTDPPYGLEFMGKEWDSFTDPAARFRSATAADDKTAGLTRGSMPDAYRAGAPFQRWCEQWAVECLRVLKPGGHLLAFGGTRTWHRLACAVEDAGFEVRDSIAWLYGSGFPKSLDVSKAIDKAAGVEREVVGLNPNGRNVEPLRYGGDNARPNLADNPPSLTAPATPDAARWQGWGTALKPAFEPVVVARKPLGGTVASNVLEWGCGAINIEACRVQADGSSGQGSSREATPRGCGVHDVRPVREADGAVAVAGQAGQVADDLRAGVSQRADARGEQSQLAGRDLDRSTVGLSAGVGSEPEPGGPGATAEAVAPRVPGAPLSDGAQDRTPADCSRDGAPHQRREGGQPTGEPAPDGLGGSLPGAPSDRARVDGAASGERAAEGCTCGADREVTRAGEASAERRYTERGGTNFAPLPGVRGGSPAGRWPANVVLDDTQAAALDEQSAGTRASLPSKSGSESGDKFGGTAYGVGLTGQGAIDGYDDQGGASRFFYVAKAPTAERVKVDGIAHPTVKPLALMRWLVRLVTPPGGTVLEPFAGSGTTVEACILEGFHVVAIEREADYLPLIAQRIHRRKNPVEAVRGSLTQEDDDMGLFDLLDTEGPAA